MQTSVRIGRSRTKTGTQDLWNMKKNCYIHTHTHTHTHTNTHRGDVHFASQTTYYVRIKSKDEIIIIIIIIIIITLQ
jgi:hypothetical protein